MQSTTSEDPLFLANQLSLAGQPQMAASLLQSALMSSPGRMDLRQRFEELLAILPEEDAELLRSRDRHFSSMNDPLPSRRKWHLALAFALMAMFAAFLVGYATSGFQWVGPACIAVSGALLVIVLGLRWKDRLPLRYGGSELRYSERPFSYHLCSFALMVFAVLLSLSGLLAVYAPLK